MARYEVRYGTSSAGMVEILLALPAIGKSNARTFDGVTGLWFDRFQFCRPGAPTRHNERAPAGNTFNFLLAFFFNILYIRLGCDEPPPSTELQRDGAPTCHERRAGEHSMPYMASLCSCKHADTISGQNRFFVKSAPSTSTTCGGKSGQLSAFQAASLETQPACKHANTDERRRTHNPTWYHPIRPNDTNFSPEAPVSPVSEPQTLKPLKSLTLFHSQNFRASAKIRRQVPDEVSQENR
jgi:hypothetical protein